MEHTNTALDKRVFERLNLHNMSKVLWIICKYRRDGGTEGRRDGGTEGRRDGGTEGRRDRGTKGRRDGGTDRQTDGSMRFYEIIRLE